MKINFPAPHANWPRRLSRILAMLAVMLAVLAHPNALLAQQRKMEGHVPEAAKRLRPLSRKAATETLELNLGLQLRNADLMASIRQSQYNPASTNYHKWLTPQQFAELFGPTEADYQKVVAFANASGFKVTGTFTSRRLLKVSATVGQIEKTFQVRMMNYQHPTEARQFYAPDAEPSVDVSLPLLSVGQLDNFIVPRPLIHFAPQGLPGQGTPLSQNGSAPGGSGAYFGSDFRNAYLGSYAAIGNTGSGQQIGLLEFNEAITPQDFTSYASQASINNNSYNVQYYNGVSGYGDNNPDNGEASLDVEVALAMAPGAIITTFDGSDADTIFDAMVQDPAILQFSASWTYGLDAGSDGYFQQMAMQGQSFFNASGDYDSQNSTSALFHGSSLADPNITIVGGTELVTDTSHNYSSESVWNARTVNPVLGNWGSTGGISAYSVPSWQSNALAGAYSHRCTPDVSMVADHVYVIFSKNGTTGKISSDTSGTSIAAPLWAGYMALVNAQAAAAGQPGAGFINPAVYAIYTGASNFPYASSFHDTTTGDNTWSGMPSQFFATNGYDLCTGLGSPTSALVYALSGTLSTVWVYQPNPFFPSLGTFTFPYNLLTQGVANVPADGTIVLKSGSASPGAIQITKPMHIVSVGGATIGP